MCHDKVRPFHLGLMHFRCTHRSWVYHQDYLERMQGKIPEADNDVPLHATLTITQDLQLDMDAVPRDTFVSHGSWNAALLSAGAVCKGKRPFSSSNRSNVMF